MINRQRLEFATTGFLAEMRKQFAKLYPAAPNPIKALSDYPPDQRSALMAAVERSIVLAGDKHDPTFSAWQVKRAEAAEAQSDPPASH